MTPVPGHLIVDRETFLKHQTRKSEQVSITKTNFQPGGLARKTEFLPQTEQMYFAISVASHEEKRISCAEPVMTSTSEQFRAKMLNLTINDILGDAPLQRQQIYESIVPQSADLPYSPAAFQILAEEHLQQIASFCQNKDGNGVGANDIQNCFTDDVPSEDIDAFLNKLGTSIG